MTLRKVYFLFYYRFNLVKEDCVEFNQLAMANAEGSDDMLNRVMTKDNIGLAAMLETKEGAYDSGWSLWLIVPSVNSQNQIHIMCQWYR